VTDTSLRRRTFLTLSAALLGSSAVPAFAMAQTPAPAAASAPAPAAPAAPPPMPFSFDILSDMMRQKAKNDFASAEIQLPPFIAGLTYDEYQHIQYRPDHARWSDPGSLFRINTFHMGWLFKEPVFLYEVQNGAARRLDFTTGDFNYYNPAIDQLASSTRLPAELPHQQPRPLR
jgi:glucans biosynthesis protein